MSANSGSCVNDIIRFLERITGRLSFEEYERLFCKALDKNPIFARIEKAGVFGKNVIVLLGGRGCGKSLVLRYIKHRLSKEGWDFKYVSYIKRKGDEALNLLRQVLEEVESKLKKDSNYKAVIAIDDVVEADEVAREYLRDSAISLIHEYAGRVKLVLAAQSERVTAEGVATIQLLKVVLGQAPHAEALFGEHPMETIEEVFKNSYINKALVRLFRGAAMVNLDAYWSSLRSLDNVEKLANVIVGITEFYVNNMNSSGCSKLVDEVKKCKHGLALLALSSLPKIADPAERIIIEYGEPKYLELDIPVPALNGLGVATLLFKFFKDEDIRRLAEKAEKIYNYLKSTKAENIGTDDIKGIILKASREILSYADVVQKGSVRTLGLPLPQETGEGRKRRKYGPKIDLIYVKRKSAAGREEHSYLVLHELRLDSRGYVSSSSSRKLRELVEIGVPSEAELRYLIIIVPSKEHKETVYRWVPIERIGHDILVLLADTLSDIDRALIHLLRRRTGSKEEAEELGFEIDEEAFSVMLKIVLGTVLFNLRDHHGTPHLAYHLLPTIH